VNHGWILAVAGAESNVTAKSEIKCNRRDAEDAEIGGEMPNLFQVQIFSASVSALSVSLRSNSVFEHFVEHRDAYASGRWWGLVHDDQGDVA
jgi:hypothetical protein